MSIRETQDHYFREAKREGYLSRAAYKLIEIDDRRRVLRKGDRVLDCGCAPGSWVQVAARRIGPRGAVVGIDLQAVARRLQAPNVRYLVADLTETDADALRPDGKPFDVILSDMAPNTTGVPFSDHYASIRLCEHVLDRCPDLLRPGGHLVMKVFEGEAYPQLLARTKERFDKVKGLKPKASRDDSVEMFVIAQGFRSSAQPAPHDR